MPVDFTARDDDDPFPRNTTACVCLTNELRERLFVSAHQIGPGGRCNETVDNTVDVEQVTFTISIGDALLMGVWEDPYFDPSERALHCPSGTCSDGNWGVLEHS